MKVELRSPRGAEWELFALCYVGRVLAQVPPIVKFERDALFGVTLFEWIAFLEGVCDHTETTNDASDAFDAGRLARIVLDERRTYATRIWEIVAERGRSWSTVDVIEKIYNSRYALLQSGALSHYLRVGDFERQCARWTRGKTRRLEPDRFRRKKPVR